MKIASAWLAKATGRRYPSAMSARAFAVLLMIVLMASGIAIAAAEDGGRVLVPLILSPARPAHCDPAYPTICFPSPPPDLDCPEVLPHQNFPVLPPDPHGFDADSDGVGCEFP